MSSHSKLIVILGPTASGKTGLSLKLAKKFGGEVVSADSRQIYKGMDIGTGKVEDKKGVRHYLFDVVRPDEEFTLADYKKKAVAAIRDILKRGKVPFLVGGTGLYIQAVVDNLEIPAVPPNKKLRAQFEKELALTPHPSPLPQGERGIDSRDREKVIKKWYKKLLKLDPGAAEVVDAKNPRRIIRALEVCLSTGKQFSKLREKGKPLFDVLQIGINLPREKLYDQIDERVEQMIKDGLAGETKKLLKKYSSRLPSMSGIGYKEIGEYLSQKVRKSESQKALNEAAQKIKFRTHAYARRQMTWFRRDKRIKWIKNYAGAEKEIVKWLGQKSLGA
jgi:tRNA dimethylallyltransferase